MRRSAALSGGRGRRGLMASEREPYRIEGRTGAWEVVLGLEVHAQVASNAKLFSGASTGFGAAPNIDHAQPFVKRDLCEWMSWLRSHVGFDGWR